MQHLTKVNAEVKRTCDMTTGKMKLKAMPRYFPRPTCLLSWLSEVSLHCRILKLQAKGKTFAAEKI